MKQTCTLFILLVALLAGLCNAGEDRWARFDKPPLTILFPEEDALSNPPFFHWQPMAGAAEYRIRVSGSAGAQDWSTSRNFFTPPTPLKPGYYTVQISATDTERQTLGQSDPREFRMETRTGLTLPAEEPVTARHKPLAFPPEEIEAIRMVTGPRAELRDRLLKIARDPRPEALRDLQEPAPYTNNTWNYEQWNQGNTLCFAVEDYVMKELVAYRLTGEKSFSGNARDILLVVARWDPGGSTGVWSNDHSAWSVLHVLALGYCFLGDQLAPEEKAILATGIEKRCRDLYAFLNPFFTKDTSSGPMNDPDNNHPWFCAAALGMGGLALLDDVPDARHWVDFTTQLFHGVFLPRGGRNGGWHEGIDYWSYMLYFVFQYCDALQTVTGFNLYDHPWLKTTAFFKIYTHPPRGGYVPFGDCKHQQPTGFDKLVMMRLASEYKDPMAWRYVDAVPEDIGDNRVVYALQWSDRSGVDPSKTIEYPFAVQFQDIGWVVSNSDVFHPDDQILLAFRSGKFYGRRFGHSHADQNNFTLAAGGDKLLWDAGYYDSYLSPHHRAYTSQSKAHNVILAGGQGQVAFTRGTDGTITEYETHDDSLHVQGNASTPIIYGGKIYQWHRTLDYAGKKDLVVRDDIWLAEADTVSWLLHSAYPIVYNPKDRTLEITGDHYRLTATFETDVPVDASLTTTFPERPGQKGKVYTDPKESPYKDQYHLELRTVLKVEQWKPVFRATLSRCGSGATPETPQ